MASTKSNISASLGADTDKDLLKFIERMNKSGIRNSQLVKDALRFYRDHKDKVEEYERASKVNLVDKDEIQELIEQTVRNMNLAPVQQPVYQPPYGNYNQPMQQQVPYQQGMPQQGYYQQTTPQQMMEPENDFKHVLDFEDNDDDMDFSDMS